MILTVEAFRQLVETDETDAMLEMRLKALEQFVRGYTNNNFQVRGTGRVADVAGGLFIVEALNPYEVGDTLHVSGSRFNDGLYTVSVSDDSTFRVNERTQDENDIFVTLVEYPEDVKMGVVEMMKYDMHCRDKANIASETISRHSVTYQTYDAESVASGYPEHLLGFLRRHRKARFGQGLSM